LFRDWRYSEKLVEDPGSRRRYCRNCAGGDKSGGPGPRGLFFGLFGSSEAPPGPRPDIASYAVEIQVEPEALASNLQDASNLYRLRQNPPESGEGLARLAAADLPRLVDALWAEGYYDALARAIVERQPIAMRGAGLDAAARAADRAIGRPVIPVRLVVETGVLYRMGTIRIVDARTRQEVDPERVQPRVLKLQPGDPARASAIRDMQTRLLDAVRGQSYPLAKVTRAQATVRRPEKEVDLLVELDSGPRRFWRDYHNGHTRSRSRRGALVHLCRSGGSLFVGQNRGHAQVDGADRRDRLDPHSRIRSSRFQRQSADHRPGRGAQALCRQRRRAIFNH
jgi:hypothetical protein